MLEISPDSFPEPVRLGILPPHAGVCLADPGVPFPGSNLFSFHRGKDSSGPRRPERLPNLVGGTQARDYRTLFTSLKIGVMTEMAMKPTTTPKKMMSRGSIMEVRPFTVCSTSPS